MELKEQKEVVLPEEEKESPYKKVIIITLACLLIILFLTYIIANSIGLNILSGFISSKQTQGNQLDFTAGGKIEFMNNSLEQLQLLFAQNPNKEFKSCLKGSVFNDTYIINQVYIPKIYSQEVNEVISDPCSDDSLVDLHSHPKNHCLPSQQDFITFKHFKSRQPLGLMIVMCTPNRFAVYDKA